jgi:Phospholipase_D-nuclease N-terminal
MLIAGFFDQGFFRGLLLLGIAFCWGFALYDLVRRPLAGWKKAMWFLVILIFPLAGAMIYLLISPIAETPYAQQDFVTGGELRDPRPQLPHGGI